MEWIFKNVLIQIIHSGSRIPNNNLPFIFDSFYRPEDVIDETFNFRFKRFVVKNSLGLYKGNIIVENNNGKMAVLSTFLPPIRINFNKRKGIQDRIIIENK